jgi:hypothetical protein
MNLQDALVAMLPEHLLLLGILVLIGAEIGKRCGTARWRWRSPRRRGHRRRLLAGGDRLSPARRSGSVLGDARRLGGQGDRAGTRLPCC